MPLVPEEHMAYGFKFADLAKMTEAEKQVMLAEAEGAAGAARNGQAVVMNARIRELESRHGMDSETMRAGLESGRIPEDAEIARWLYLLDTRDNRVRE
jgi:hypothetical protein